MPRKYPVVSGKQTVRALQRDGFVKINQEGSHVRMRKMINGREINCSVPMDDEIAIGTLRSILTQAEISLEKFKQLLKLSAKRMPQ